MADGIPQAQEQRNYSVHFSSRWQDNSRPLRFLSSPVLAALPGDQAAALPRKHTILLLLLAHLHSDCCPRLWAARWKQASQRCSLSEMTCWHVGMLADSSGQDSEPCQPAAMTISGLNSGWWQIRTDQTWQHFLLRTTLKLDGERRGAHRMPKQFKEQSSLVHPRPPFTSLMTPYLCKCEKHSGSHESGLPSCDSTR